MKKKHHPQKINIGNIISALVFGLLLVGLVVYAFSYDPGTQFNNSFFDDVARSVQWK